MKSNLSAPPSIRATRSSRLFHLAAILGSLVVLVAGVGIASGAEGPIVEADLPSGVATPQQTWEALQAPATVPLAAPGADATVAAELPHENLDTAEALELVEGVFPEQLESTAGIYGELEPSRFLDDHTAVVPIGSLPGPDGDTSGQPAPDLGPGAQTIVESALPLRTENAEGEEEAVDVSLEPSEGELRPENPLTAVGLPTRLEEGVSLPGVGVTIELPDAEGGSEASEVEGDFAFYPNVAEETDLLAAPLPTGVETMTDIRSAAAPQNQTFRLSMPAGASLRAEDGGAEVVEGDRALVMIPPPTATDASGAPVPVSMTVSGDELEVSLGAAPGTTYPILVDPAFLNEEWSWYARHDSTAGWTPYASTVEGAYRALPYAFFWGPSYPGLDMTSGFEGGAPSGTVAGWYHFVPRYEEDIAHGFGPPTSYMHELFVEGIYFLTHGDASEFPMLFYGLVNRETGWAYYASHRGTEGELASLNDYAMLYNQAESPAVKVAQMSLATFQDEYPRPKLRDAYFANAVTVVADDDAPKILQLTSPSRWIGTTATPIGYKFEDTGLGVRAAMMTVQGASEAHPNWGRDFGCTGSSLSPCPRVVASSEPGRPGLNYDPTELPTGEDRLTVTLGDATWAPGHEVTSIVTLKVDHLAPEVKLSGSLTEQARLGTERGSYVLNVAATDGSAAAPQSGVAKVMLRNGNEGLGTVEQACSTKNCPLTHSFTVSEEAVGSGAHTLEVVAEDAAGNKSVTKLPVTFTPDHTAPSIELSGPLATAPKGWITQKSYEAVVRATDAGSGVKRLTVQLDGTTVTSKEQSCAAGGCGLSASPAIDATTLSGGSHEMTLTAEDAAGNVSTIRKTLNVDPVGTATPASVARALKAAEETGAPTTVGISKEEAALEGTAAGLELAAVQGGFEAKNPAIPLQVPSSAAAGPTVTVFNAKLVGACHGGAEEAEEAPQKAEICENAEVGGELYAAEIKLQPTSSATSASVMTLENGYATLSTNTQTEQDTLIRPLYEGAIDYQVLRSKNAPASATWTLGPMEGLHLAAVDARHIEVVDAAGRATLTLVAESATDATGKSVPTKLEISGPNKVTLDAEVPATAVYPVVAGLAFRGGTLHIEAEGPKTEAELHREEERVEGEIKELEQMEREGRRASHGPNFHNAYTTLEIGRFGPPVWESTSSKNVYDYEFSHCNWGNTLPESWISGIGPRDEGTEAEKRAWEDTVGNCIKDTGGKKFDDAEILRGTVHFLKGEEVWFTEADTKHMECLKTGPEKPAMVHCYVEPEHSKTGITVGGNYRRRPLGGVSICETVYAHINTKPPYHQLFQPINSRAGSLKLPAPEYCSWPSR